MTNDLRSSSVRGALWSAVDALGSRLLQFAVGVILARLLLPEQFGLIGMLAIFMALSHILLNGGFSFALVQKEEVTDVDTSTVFLFNLAMSIALAALLWLAAPWVARFYSQPVLTQLLRVLVFVKVVDAFTVVPLALLSRRMDFKTQTRVHLIASLLSGAIAIAMAYHGYGVWALMIQQVSAAFFRAVLVWGSIDWRPRLVFSYQSLRTMFRFGSRLMLSGLLNGVSDNLYYVIIGRMFSPALLGFYTRARHIEKLPTQTVSKVLNRVAFPAFSSIQGDNARLVRGLRKALQVALLWNAPAMIGLAVIAEPLVLVLLAETWLPVVPYLQLLCIAGLIQPLHPLNLSLLTAKGRSDLFLRLEIVKKALLLAGIVLAVRWGVVGLIVSQVVVSYLSFFVNSYYTRRLIDYGPIRQLRDIAIYFVFAALMGLGVFLLRLAPFPSQLSLLTAQIAAGAVLYAMICLLVRPAAVRELWDVMQSSVRGVKTADQPVA